MRSFGRRVLFCVQATACLGFLPAIAFAEEENSEPAAQPLVEPEERRSFFTLNQVNAFLEIESTFDQRRVDYERRGLTSPQQRQTNRSWQLQEALGFRLSGSLVDPAIINYDAEISFGLSQDHYDERNWLWKKSDSDWGQILNYDLRMNLFPGRPLSGSVYARRMDDRISRPFLSTLDEQRTGFGMSLYRADSKLPMELTYDYLETDRTGNADRRDDEHYTDSSLHYGLQWLISEFHRFKLSYEHANTKQKYQGSAPGYETTRDLFTIEHELEFGEFHQHELRTLVHWQEESGDFARDYLEIRPELRLRHTDSLQTIYRYDFLSEKYEQFDIDRHHAEFEFVHQLYSNLTTTGHLFGLYEQIDDDLETYQYGAGLDFQYNRKNPLGHFYSHLSIDFDNEHTRGDNGTRVVLNEAATFRDPIAVTLRNQNVLPFSIRVTDAANSRIFLHGVDYIAIRQGHWTRLARIPTGRIADRETVLVDYAFATPSDGEVDTVRVNYGIEQRFQNGLTPYYYFDFRNQEIGHSTGFAVAAERTNHHRMGLKYEKQRWSVGAEFEIFDDSVDPYDAFHIDGRYSLVQNNEHNLDMAGRLSQFYFVGGFDDRQVLFLDLELDHRWYLNSFMSMTNRAAYRFEHDSIGGETNGVDLASGLNCRWGDLTLEMTLEYDRLELPYSGEDGISAWIRVRRDFPGLLSHDR